MTRAAALPERAHYRDRGCDLHPSCLACPLPRCRYGVVGGARTVRLAARDPEVRAMREAGAGITEIAEHHGMSRRNVFRVLE